MQRVLLVSVLASVLARNNLEPIVLQQQADGQRVFVDSFGRERIFHGTNAVVKGPPWHPDSRSFSTDISMSKEDFQWMQSLGLNVLRLGVFWAGVEPVRAQYNESYLDELERIVELAAAHGVYTLLDMHQDGLSEYFCGEGFPSWAVQRAQNPRKRWPFPYQAPLRNDSDMYVESRLGGEPRIPTSQACEYAFKGAGWGESCEEAAQAYQALWSNVDGIGDAFAAMWAKVSARFSHRPEILGLEILNEPFAGDLYSDPLIMVPYPNPRNADAKNLQPTYDRVSAAIRAVNADVLLFFAGVTWDDAGAGFTAPPGGAHFANRSVLAYHYYRPPQISFAAQLAAYKYAARRLGTAHFLTESDSLPGRGKVAPGGLADEADTNLQSWATWEWKNFYRGTGDSQSQLNDWGSAKTGHAPQWSKLEPPKDLQLGYSRTYAVAVAGHTKSMSFDVTNGNFQLKYDVLSNASNVPTEIFTWPERYPGGPLVKASVSIGNLHVKYNSSSGQVLIYPAGGVEQGAEVTVRISQRAAQLEGVMDGNILV